MNDSNYIWLHTLDLFKKNFISPCRAQQKPLLSNLFLSFNGLVDFFLLGINYISNFSFPFSMPKTLEKYQKCSYAGPETALQNRESEVKSYFP
jgi:hypothetical protein